METPQTIANTQAIADLTKIVSDMSISVTAISKDVETISRDGQRTYEEINTISNFIIELAPVTKLLKKTDDRVLELENENKLGVRPKTLKNLLVFAATIIIGFGSTATVFYFSLDKTLASHIVQTEEKCKALIKEMESIKAKTQDNKNQITYLKGSKKNKESK